MGIEAIVRQRDKETTAANIARLSGKYLQSFPYQIAMSELAVKRKEIQIKSDQTERLLNKPYVNEVTLTGQNPPLKYC